MSVRRFAMNQMYASEVVPRLVVLVAIFFKKEVNN